MHEGLSSVPNEGLYLPRNGEDIDAQIQILSEAPRSPLSEDEKLALRDFEAQLLTGHFTTPQGEQLHVAHPEGKTLPELVDGYKYAGKRHEVTADFLLTEKGQLLLGTYNLASDFQTPQEAGRFVRSQALFWPQDALKTLSKESENYAAERITDALVHDKDMQDPERVFVFEDTSRLLIRTGGLLAYRSFLRSVRHEQGVLDDGSNLNQARTLVNDIYQKFVNQEIAKLYPDILHLWAQADAMPEVQKNIIQGSIRHLHEPFATLGRRFVGQQTPTSIIRLDRLRNGVNMGPGGYGAVSHELKTLFASEQEEAPVSEEPMFRPEEIAKLDTIRFDAEQLKGFFELVLAKFGKLSDERVEAYLPDRPTRAGDSKWQVVIANANISSAEVVDPPGYVKIPPNFNRTLTAISPAGVIPLVAHEILHVYQKDNIRNNDSLLLASELGGGKRNSVMLETGSILVEQLLQRRLFGRERRDNPHYMRAMEAVDDGGGEMAATKAFYESYRTFNPDAAPEEAARTAISRTKRLIRRQGGYDSQALNYAETALLAAKTANLPQSTRHRLFAEGSFDLTDLCRLHEFGLDPQAPEVFPLDEYLAIVTEVFRDLLNKEQVNNEENPSSVIG